MTDVAGPSGGTISWLAVLLLPLTMPLYMLVVLGRMILRPSRPRERRDAAAILVVAVAWVVFLSWLPDAAMPWLGGVAVAFLVTVSIMARRATPGWRDR